MNIIFRLFFISLLFCFFGCESSGNDDSFEESDSGSKKHRGVDFLPPVKEYKDRAGSAKAASENKAKEVHRQFEMLEE